MSGSLGRSAHVERIRFEPSDPHHEPTSVIITGQFDAWARSLYMDKVEDRVWEAQVPLAACDQHASRLVFKFVVDGRWECCHLYPTTNDEHGNENNYVVCADHFSDHDDHARLSSSDLKMHGMLNKFLSANPRDLTYSAPSSQLLAGLDLANSQDSNLSESNKAVFACCFQDSPIALRPSSVPSSSVTEALTPFFESTRATDDPIGEQDASQVKTISGALLDALPLESMGQSVPALAHATSTLEHLPSTSTLEASSAKMYSMGDIPFIIRPPSQTGLAAAAGVDVKVEASDKKVLERLTGQLPKDDDDDDELDDSELRDDACQEYVPLEDPEDSTTKVTLPSPPKSPTKDATVNKRPNNKRRRSALQFFGSNQSSSETVVNGTEFSKQDKLMRRRTVSATSSSSATLEQEEPDRTTSRWKTLFRGKSLSKSPPRSSTSSSNKQSLPTRASNQNHHSAQHMDDEKVMGIDGDDIDDTDGAGLLANASNATPDSDDETPPVQVQQDTVPTKAAATLGVTHKTDQVGMQKRGLLRRMFRLRS